jgi:hypothetical protein
MEKSKMSVALAASMIGMSFGADGSVGPMRRYHLQRPPKQNQSAERLQAAEEKRERKARKRLAVAQRDGMEIHND